MLVSSSYLDVRKTKCIELSICRIFLKPLFVQLLSLTVTVRGELPSAAADPVFRVRKPPDLADRSGLWKKLSVTET